MTRAAYSPRAARILRVLGDELRSARRQRRWTREALTARLEGDLSIQALATYELGTRNVTVTRLIELADVLGVSVLELLERALHRVSYVGPDASVVSVDLVAVVADGTPELAPFRRWAWTRFGAQPAEQGTVVRLNAVALDALAEVCGIDRARLVRVLGDFAAPERDGSAKAPTGA